MTNKDLTFLAVIPARSGSKGIRHKNVRSFCGKPLIYYTIAGAKRSRYISRIVVSTESEEIATVARRFGAEVPFLRPPALARDRSKIFDAVKHLLLRLRKAEGYAPDYIVLLQPTSPFRTASDIDATIELLLKRRADSAITVSFVEPRVFVKARDGALALAVGRHFLRSTNRQAFPETVAENGSMVYVNRVSTLLRTRNFLGGKLVGYVTPHWRSVDLDRPEDFVLGELVFKRRHRMEKEIADFI